MLNRVPLPRERLVFPTTGQSFSTNDYPAGFALHSIEITGPHTLNGNAVQLTEGLFHTSAQNAAVNLAVGGTVGITKNGPGLLILNAANPFTGIVLVVAGHAADHQRRRARRRRRQHGRGGWRHSEGRPPGGSGGVTEAVQLNGSGVGGIGALEGGGPVVSALVGPDHVVVNRGDRIQSSRVARAIGRVRTDLRKRRTHEGRRAAWCTHRHRHRTRTPAQPPSSRAP